MAKEKILIIEDEEDIIALVKYNLQNEGYKVFAVTTGEEALSEAKLRAPDLILLDLMLPGLDGFEVCKRLKGGSDTKHIPIVMVTAKGEDADIVTGLELGADDYITKPFSPRVLIARIRTILRRNSRADEEIAEVVKIDDLTIDSARHEVLIKNKPIDLTATEFGILHYLARQPGWVFTRNQIIGAIKGDDYPVTERSIDVQIVGLRKKLGETGKLIETVRGVGYRFREPE